MTVEEYVVGRVARKLELLSVAEVAEEPSVQIALRIAAGGYPPWDVVRLLPRPTLDFRAMAREYQRNAFCPLGEIPCWYTRAVIEAWVCWVMGRRSGRP